MRTLLADALYIKVKIICTFHKWTVHCYDVMRDVCDTWRYTQLTLKKKKTFRVLFFILTWVWLGMGVLWLLFFISEFHVLFFIDFYFIFVCLSMCCWCFPLWCLFVCLFVLLCYFVFIPFLYLFIVYAIWLCFINFSLKVCFALKWDFHILFVYWLIVYVVFLKIDRYIVCIIQWNYNSNNSDHIFYFYINQLQKKISRWSFSVNWSKSICISTRRICLTDKNGIYASL